MLGIPRKLGERRSGGSIETGRCPFTQFSFEKLYTQCMPARNMLLTHKYLCERRSGGGHRNMPMLVCPILPVAVDGIVIVETKQIGRGGKGYTNQPWSTHQTIIYRLSWYRDF